jgi:hypothetical protein
MQSLYEQFKGTSLEFLALVGDYSLLNPDWYARIDTLMAELEKPAEDLN